MNNKLIFFLLCVCLYIFWPSGIANPEEPVQKTVNTKKFRLYFIFQSKDELQKESFHFYVFSDSC